MRSRRLVLTLLAAAALAQGGCATALGLTCSRRPYGATRVSVAMVAHDLGIRRLGEGSSNIGVILLFELPLTLGVDTALLPVMLALHPSWRCSGCGPVRCEGEEEEAPTDG
ncbi:MAG TPA: hypothetical protein DEA08_15305 [Planctomycetes bacterium]|nr:hypothetical protein [Planctomycetota bacterium]